MEMIVMHTLDGRDVYVNPRHVISISVPREDKDAKKQLTPGVQCVVSFSDGKFVTVVEKCGEVLKKVREYNRRG